MSQFGFNKSHFLASPETVLVKTNLDRIVGFISELCEASYAAINITSEDRNLVRASKGLETTDPSLIKAMCDYSLQFNRYYETNALAANKKESQPAVLSDITFYAGAVLRRSNGTPFGALCIWDNNPIALTDLQRDAVKLCAQHASQHIELSRLLSQARNKSGLMTQDASLKTAKDYWQNFEELTPREKQVLNVILDNTGDSSNKKIARILNISPRTVELHRARVFAKMQVRSAAELVAQSFRSSK